MDNFHRTYTLKAGKMVRPASKSVMWMVCRLIACTFLLVSKNPPVNHRMMRKSRFGTCLPRMLIFWITKDCIFELMGRLGFG